MASRQAAGRPKLCSVRIATGILTPGHFAGVLVEVGAGDMMMLTEFSAAEAGIVAFRLIDAGAIHAVGAPVVDPSHLVPCMQIVPGARFVAMDRASPGDALSDDWHSFGLAHRDDRHGRTTALAHHHDT